MGVSPCCFFSSEFPCFGRFARGYSSFRNIHLLYCGILHGLQCKYHLRHGCLWAACGYNLLHSSLLHGLQGISSLVPGASPSPLSLVFPLLFHTLSVLSFSIYPALLKRIFLEMPPTLLRGSAVLCAWLVGTFWKRLFSAWGSPGLFSERPPYSPTLPAPGHINQIHLPKLV